MSGAQQSDPRALLDRCRDPGFTPGTRDVAPLVAAWGTAGEDRSTRKDHRKAIATALGRGDRGVAEQLIGGLAEVDGEQRAMRLSVLSRIARRISVPELGEILLQALRDPTPRVVREAARAVGKAVDIDGADYEEALVSVCERAAPAERRAAVEALGRVGGTRALAYLHGMQREDDDLTRRTAQAITLIERRAGRGEASRIVGSEPLPHPTAMVLRCRAGAAAIVANQVATRLPGTAPAPWGDASVTFTWSGPLDELYRVRTAIEVGLSFALPAGDTLSDRIVAALRRTEVVQALSAWTETVVRFRLAFAHGGHRRATVWEVAQRLTADRSPLVNDSRDAPWTIEVDESSGHIVCLPRGADPRFTYRHMDVPAASHPSLAATLAWVGRPRAGELVWDPFCGSGSELIECARLEPDLRLFGTDNDPRAIVAARTNFTAAQISETPVQWSEGDACTTRPGDGGGVSLILTNPPMGRRLARDGSMRPLLTRFVAHAANVLAPGGRMVWVTPTPRVTAGAGRDAGLAVRDVADFDMGGFVVAVQVLRKPT